MSQEPPGREVSPTAVTDSFLATIVTELLLHYGARLKSFEARIHPGPIGAGWSLFWDPGLEGSRGLGPWAPKLELDCSEGFNVMWSRTRRGKAAAGYRHSDQVWTSHSFEEPLEGWLVQKAFTPPSEQEADEAWADQNEES